MSRQLHQLRSVLLSFSFALIACQGTTEAESSPAAKPSGPNIKAKQTAAPRLTTATAHARQAIDTLIAGIKSGDGAATAALFDHGAVALVGAPHEVDEPDLVKTLGRIGPHDVVTDVKLVQLVVGGNNDLGWLFADLTITKHNQEPGEKATAISVSVHATELLSAAANWKVVAAAFSESRTAGRLGGVFPMIETTESGPLAALVASPAKIEAALANDPNIVVALNDNQLAVGVNEAKVLLDAWTKRSLTVNGAVREVRNERWGFVQANIDWNEPGGKPYRFSAQLIAIPRSDGSWNVVAAQYLAL